jgi:hypothetical protein
MNNISLTKLNKVNLYSFSFPDDSHSLTESIKKVGVLQPILLTKSRDIICGTRRLNSCKKLKLTTIPSITIDKDLTPLEYFVMNLEDNLSARKINIIEKSIILNKLQKDFSVPLETIISKYLPALDIPANIKYFDKYVWINNLAGNLKAEIAKKDISFDILCAIKNWPKKSINSLFVNILDFNLGNSKTLQIINLLNEISARDKKPVRTPLHTIEWKTISNNLKIPIHQKGQQLREFLLSKRYPSHTTLRNKIKYSISKLKLPKGISIMPDIYTMENNFINFKIECRQKKDLTKSAKTLSETAVKKEMQELLNLLKA